MFLGDFGPGLPLCPFVGKEAIRPSEGLEPCDPLRIADGSVDTQSFYLPLTSPTLARVRVLLVSRL